MEIKKKLPKDHKPYTDKYFIRAKQILEAEGINPIAGMRVFARGKGEVKGLDNAVEAITHFSDVEKTGEIWTTKDSIYKTEDTLLLIKAPILTYVDLETLYLGIISDAITEAVGISRPDYNKIKEKFQRLKLIYGDVPITYFGARHYHWSLDKEIAQAALDGGAVQTSTDNGSSYKGMKGVGTTPHVLTLVLASIYGKDKVTLKTAELFDKYMPQDIARMTLVDTFNKEITDSLMVARFFGKRKNFIRIDTCGENIGEGCSLYKGKKEKDPSYNLGTGVTIELVTNVRERLIKEGYGGSIEIFLTSGFGNEDKARAFSESNDKFMQRTNYNLFCGVGVGEVCEAKFCTADIFEINGRPIYKTGREKTIDYSKLKRVV